MSQTRLPKRRLLVWLFLFLGLLSSFVQAQQFSDPETFVEAILSRHPSIQKADELVQAAEFNIKAAGLQPNPNLTLAATAGDPGEDSNSLTQMLEISGQPALRRNIAGLNLEAAKNQRDAIHKQVAGNAYRNWLELWRAHRLMEMAQIRDYLLKEMVRVAKRRFEVGEIAENEALRVELASTQAETNLVEAIAEFNGARNSAAILLGVALDDYMPNPTEMGSLLPDTLDLDTVMVSVNEHPEIRGKYLQLTALELGAELIRKERAPTLGLSLYRSSLIRTQGQQQGFQVSLSWPIFDWGSIRHRAESQMAQSRAFAAEIEESLLQTRQSLAKVWERLQAARTNRTIIARQAERYEELAREARVAYDVGLWSLTDVLQTEQSYRQAGVELLEARAQVLELEIHILENTGLSFPTEHLKEAL